MILPPHHVGIFGNWNNPEVLAILPSVKRWLGTKGRRVTIEQNLARRVRGAGPGVPLATLVRRVDTLLVLGGDGTMLLGARAASRTGVPVVGINLGGLGFLTDTGAEELFRALTKLFRGDFKVERRLMIETRVRSGRTGRTWSATGLNEAVIHARDRSRVLSLDLRIGRTPIGTLVADGLIVATPTGSTAYSLSAGGPILRPTIEALITTPISPHTLTFRPLIVGADETVSGRLRPGHAPAAVTVDGYLTRRLSAGDEVLIRRADLHVDLLVLERASFYEVLRTKLAWAELPRARKPRR